ncbi:flagella biosynthesis chaperone for FliD, FliT [Shewanella sp. ALD9]|uniref:flagella biosynthesis chaperone for FliD, FliT n=1 Tax=Shewanella sp. ALD9 TaxID=2058330 RepID=UPI000C34C455|nr:flagella biosynthesis chaperone for FliD, FliT [Shewanella sp. ALD9]PKH33202.1 flagella biosynthesis chaperone for FliD, FliT [Shewanella sp. ALD9]
MYSLNRINYINNKLMFFIDKIEKSKPEDEFLSDLVSELLILIETRQGLINALVADTNFTDRELLEQQYDLTQTLIKQSQKIMDFRQTLLQAGNTTKRQINVYKAIDSNR